MRKPRIHVVHREDEWAVIKENAKRASHITDTQAEAKKLAREQAEREKTEVVLHGRDNKILNPNSYGDESKVKDEKH